MVGAASAVPDTLLLFTRSDRGIFLLNFVPFLLLPGLLFSFWTRLGVRGRIGWHWMWLLPTGYSFLLQAGSAGSDIYLSPELASPRPDASEARSKVANPYMCGNLLGNL